MAGFENSIEYSQGDRLEPSMAADIAQMQKSADDVSRINYTGNPEGVVSANPASLCHDPVSGIVYVKLTGTGNTGWTPLSTGPGTNVIISTYDVADSPGTWTMNAATKYVKVMVWAGGGGGGSGRKGATTASGGGSGGGNGQYYEQEGPAAFFSPSQNFVVGAGGSGGSAQTATADGNPGIIGDSTSFGAILALGGQPGSGGVTTTVIGATGRTTQGVFTGASTGSGGQGRALTGIQGADILGTAGYGNATGGGGGGGADVVTERVGGRGGNILDQANNILLAGGAGGLESTGIDGSIGNPALTGVSIFSGGTGGGGGGGYSVGAGGAIAGGTGGNGNVPAGGGGGGGGGITAVADSGAGGNGGDGRIIVCEFL